MQTLRSLEALEREGLVAPDPRLAEAAESMAIALTPEMAALIDHGDLAHDPIARQFVPSARETEIAPEELADPIGDEARSPVKGIVHRYPDRVLLKPLHVCPVYCRFCFRREKVGPGGEALSAAELDAAIAYIRARPEIWEVILTGGDPLMGQTVLLAGVNDDVETLDALMRALVRCRVKPYYLHHPDLVRGTGHFRVSVERGQALMKALRGRLSGLGQPTYVLDVPGGHGKVPIGPGYLGDDPDVLVVRDAFGTPTAIRDNPPTGSR